VLAACSVAALVLTHNLSAMIFLPMAIALVLGPPRLDRRAAVCLGSALALGLLLSSFYAVPAYFEQRLVHVASITHGFFDYHRNFTPLSKVLAEDSLHAVGRFQLLGCVLAVPVLVRAARSRDSRVAYLLGACIVLAAFSLFMTNHASAPVWSVLHPLRYLQFPWRFLETATFFLCLAAGSVATLELGGVLRPALLGGLVALIVAANVRSFRPTSYLHVTNAQLLAGPEWRASVMHSIVDYLPKAAVRAPLAPATRTYRVVEGRASVSDVRVDSDRTRLRVRSKGGSVIELSTIWFPGWSVSVNGRRAPNRHDNPFGLITVTVPPGDSTIVADFHDTPIRRVGDALSLVGLAVLAVVGFAQRRLFTAS
jgi:hypothetical protein